VSLPSLAAGLAVAALLSLDRRAFMQTMLGRPLVTGALVGAALSEPAAGLTLGLWTELLWLWRLNSGGYYTPNTPLALSAVLIALLAEGAPGPADPRARLVLGFALIPILAHLLIHLDSLLRRRAGERSRRLRERLLSLEAGGPEGVEEARRAAPASFRREALLGIPETLLASVAFLAAAVPCVMGLAALLAALLPSHFWKPVAAFAPYAPAAGLLGIASSLSRPSLPPYLLGALAALLALALLRSAGIWPLL
jgi:hypothetical protein